MNITRLYLLGLRPLTGPTTTARTFTKSTSLFARLHASPQQLVTECQHSFNLQSLRYTPLRTISSSTKLPLNYGNQPPRFNRGPPSSPLGVFWHLIPDGAKAFLALAGFTSIFFFFALPVFIIVVPPFVIGGFIFSKLYLRQRERKFSQQRDELMNTSLIYKGDPLDTEHLSKFIKNRIVEAIEVNEKDIINKFHFDQNGSQHHTLQTRLVLTDIESIDQNFNFSNLDPQIPIASALNDSITTISFGLIDRDSQSRLNRVATVIVSLKQKNIRSLIDMEDGMDCVIELTPLLNFSKSVVLNSPSSYSDHDQVFEIRQKRTKNHH